jgi:hypothetical protein
MMPARQGPWYIAYRLVNASAMKIASDREEAINSACALLAQDIDVQAVGPMIEAPEGNLISAAEIRQIRAMRLAAWQQQTAGNTSDPRVSQARTPTAEDLEKQGDHRETVLPD